MEINFDKVDNNIGCTDETILTGKHLKILVKLGKDQSVKYRIEDFTLRNTTLEAFSQSLSHSKNMLEDRFK